MKKIDFFKQQSKRLLNDFNTKKYNPEECYYEYEPKYFFDIEEIVDTFNLNSKKEFTLMNAQHIIAKLAGFYKWSELIEASDERLEIGRLLIINREAYEEEQGILTNLVEVNLIVDDWKEYEKEYLLNSSDEEKLNALKTLFLAEKVSLIANNKVILNLNGNSDAQDMIMTIMKEKNVTAEKAVLSSITYKNCVRIINTGWGEIAISLWGHDDPERQKYKLSNPNVELKINKEKMYLLHTVMDKLQIDMNEAILQFVIFKLEALGYHI